MPQFLRKFPTATCVDFLCRISYKADSKSRKYGKNFFTSISKECLSLWLCLSLCLCLSLSLSLSLSADFSQNSQPPSNILT